MELTGELLDKVKKGERVAQRALYEMYSGKMYGVCLRYFPASDMAKDVLHDSFIKVFSSIGSFRGEGSLEGWVRRIVVNTALETLRKRKNFQEVDLKSAGSVELQSGDEGHDLQVYLKIIADLPPQYRLVFNLYAIEEYTHAEIAEMLGISESTSKSNYSRARAILKRKMEKLVEVGFGRDER